MQKAVVTQALGFIGYALCRRLLEEGIEVIAIDQLDGNEVKQNKLDYFGRHALFEYHDGELGDDTVNQAIERAEVCFYIGNRSPSSHLHKKIAQSIQEIRAFLDARRAPSFTVLCSTTDVYLPNPGRIDESSRVRPISTNGTISLIEEALLLQADPTSCILRFPEIYGPSQPPEGSVHQLLSGVEPEEKPVDLLYVEDAVDALMRAASERVNGIFNAASGREDQWFLCENEANEGKAFKPDRARESCYFSIEKARNQFGFRPKTSLEIGIQKQKMSKETE